MKKMTIFDSTPAFGIDLGTTNSCIAVIGNGNRPTILPIDKKITLPSCVMWKGGNEFIVGEEAYKNRGRKNVIYSVKRLMGSGRKVKLEYNDMVREFEPWEISREILVALVTKAKQGIYKDIRDVVITVPAYFTNTQIEETKKAGEAANLNILCIMKEPTAAALLYNQEFSSKEPKKVLLYDLGGGTFDASVVLISSTQDSSLDDIYGLSSGNEKVLFSVLKVLGDTHLGGDDIDKELVHHLINHLLSQGVNLEDISSYTRELLLLKAEYYKKLGIGTYQESITINGKEVHLKDVRDAIDNGLAYATEDRKTNGLILSDTIAKNTTMARMEKVANKQGIIDIAKENKIAEDYAKAMKTKTPSVQQNVGNLSGGNQQKVLLSKWMFAEPNVLFLDEPSRGIDVGAKYEIYCIMNDMVKEGKAVVMISSELPELLGMCDRIYIMNEGNIVGEMDAKDATQEKIMSAILSSKDKGGSI